MCGWGGLSSRGANAFGAAGHHLERKQPQNMYVRHTSTCDLLTPLAGAWIHRVPTQHKRCEMVAPAKSQCPVSAHGHNQTMICKIHKTTTTHPPSTSPPPNHPRLHPNDTPHHPKHVSHHLHEHDYAPLLHTTCWQKKGNAFTCATTLYLILR